MTKVATSSDSTNGPLTVNCVWVEGGQAHVRDRVELAPQPGDSVLAVRLAALCGTDLELVRGYASFTGIPGHEFVGHVVSHSDSTWLGRRVIADINCGCRRCDECRQHGAHHCPNRTVIGIRGRHGAFADHLLVPTANLIPVPDCVPDRIAVFAEPLAAALHAIDTARSHGTESLAILGIGRLGSLVALAARSHGYDPYLVVRALRPHPLGSGWRWTTLENLPANLEGIIECTGMPDGLHLACQCVRPRGLIVAKTTCHHHAASDLNDIVVRELTVQGSRCGDLSAALSALESGRIDPRPLIGPRLDLPACAACLQSPPTADPRKPQVVP